MLIVHKNRDNHIQNFHLGRYIVGYTFGNHVLRLRVRVAVKQNFRPYIRRYTSPNENFEYSYPLNICLYFAAVVYQYHNYSTSHGLNVTEHACLFRVFAISARNGNKLQNK